MSRPRDIGDALEAALGEPEPVPSTGPALVRYAGGKAALTRQLSGMNASPRRGEYPTDEAYRAARTRWRSAARRAQRYAEGGPEGRQVRGRRRIALGAAERERVRAANVDRRYARIVRAGLRARMRVKIAVPSPIARRGADRRVRDLPAGGPGVFLDPGEVDRILAELEADPDRAAGLFREAFFNAYGMPDDADIEEVIWLKVWPDGDAEPATGQY